MCGPVCGTDGVPDSMQPAQSHVFWNLLIDATQCSRSVATKATGPRVTHPVRRPALVRPELPHQPADLLRSDRVLAFDEGVVWFELLEQGGGFERRDDVWLRGLDRHMPLDRPIANPLIREAL
jgi:hypothetical protein